MSKALVINGADFSTNKVTTISFGSVPCEGITFASNVINITDSNPVTVSYTVTPSNTTDSITWASSDDSVVTVSGGVITVVGLGTATVTATCGSYSASATVTVTGTYTANWLMGMALANANGYIGYSVSTSRIYSSGTGDQATTYMIYGAGSSQPAIKLPTGTSSVKISATDATVFLSGDYTTVIWGSDEVASESYPTAIKLVSSETAYDIRTYTEKTFSVPEGANSMAVCIRLTSSISSDADAASAATSAGLKIEFLAAE